MALFIGIQQSTFLFVCFLVNIFPFPSKKGDPLEKPFRHYAGTIVNDIAKDTISYKRVVILNFTNDEPDTNSNERELGVYLARLFTYYVGEECEKKKIELRNRKLGEIVTMEERKYRNYISPDLVLKLLEADYYVTGTYHLYNNELEIQELLAIRSIGSEVLSMAKPQRIKISAEDYARMKEREGRLVPWKQIDPKLLIFLIQNGEWQNQVNIAVLDGRTKRPLSLDSALYLGQHIKFFIELDTVPAYVYVVGWDHELNRLAFLYPNLWEKTNPITNRRMVIPAIDTLAFPIEGPVVNNEWGDYNWIKVFASKKPIKSFWVTDGYIPINAAQLMNISDELDSLGLQNWSSKMIDFWVK